MSGKDCPGCGGAMAEGFLVDTIDVAAFNTYATPSDWVKGKPQEGFLGGTKTWDKEHHRVVAYRCERCGLLQFYAPGATAGGAST
jgi:hypothetical protein